MIDEKIVLKRGDIVLADLKYMNTSNTNIQGEYRPVIVISNTFCNRNSPVITVVPLTSQTKVSLPTHVQVWKESKLHIKSIALCEQPQSIDKWRAKKIVGKCHSKILIQIEKAISIQLGLVSKRERVLSI
jgi:mRNA interferase MazF